VGSRAYEEAAVGCVVRTARDVVLHEMRESPDADLLHRHGFHVGVEVVRTVDQRVQDTRRRLAAATEAIRDELDARAIQGHFDIYFDVDAAASAPSIPHEGLARRVADFLASHGDPVFETAQLQEHAVSLVARIERRPAAGTFVSCGSRSRTSRLTLAATVLEKKHERLRYYRRQNGDHFREYWLAIASLGPGTVEDGGFMGLLARNYTTEFDRVFLVFHGPDGRLVGAHDVTPVTAGPHPGT
jgi:hypothetical protein